MHAPALAPTHIMQAPEQVQLPSQMLRNQVTDGCSTPCISTTLHARKRLEPTTRWAACRQAAHTGATSYKRVITAPCRTPVHCNICWRCYHTTHQLDIQFANQQIKTSTSPPPPPRVRSTSSRTKLMLWLQAKPCCAALHHSPA
jgi:hypothetical protein